MKLNQECGRCLNNGDFLKKMLPNERQGLGISMRDLYYHQIDNLMRLQQTAQRFKDVFFINDNLGILFSAVSPIIRNMKIKLKDAEGNEQEIPKMDYYKLRFRNVNIIINPLLRHVNRNAGLIGYQKLKSAGGIDFDRALNRAGDELRQIQEELYSDMYESGLLIPKEEH